jgi:hypothetical protein
MVKFNSLFTINKSIFKTSIEEDKFNFFKKSLFIYALKNSLDLKFKTTNSDLTSLISINNGLLKKNFC